MSLHNRLEIALGILFLGGWVCGILGASGQEPPDTNYDESKVPAYHLRSGDHEITAYHWEQYLNFADRHLRR